MSRLGPCQMILTLQVGLGDLQVVQCHMGTFVAEEFHYSGQGYTGAEQLRGICMPTIPGPE